MISDNGHLLTPLGSWVRALDQYFPYLVTEDKRQVYKQVGKRWEIFGSKSMGAKRFVKLRFTVALIPPDVTLVQVIESSTYLLVLDGHKVKPYIIGATDIYLKQQQKIIENVLGTYCEYRGYVDNLRQNWHSPTLKIICAIDGGLKDSVGTSSYAFFFPDDTQLIRSGMAGEYQPNDYASSTRQELLGQLGVEYWLSKFQERWKSRGIKSVLL